MQVVVFTIYEISTEPLQDQNREQGAISALQAEELPYLTTGGFYCESTCESTQARKFDLTSRSRRAVQGATFFRLCIGPLCLRMERLHGFTEIKWEWLLADNVCMHTGQRS